MLQNNDTQYSETQKSPTPILNVMKRNSITKNTQELTPFQNNIIKSLKISLLRKVYLQTPANIKSAVVIQRWYRNIKKKKLQPRDTSRINQDLLKEDYW